MIFGDFLKSLSQIGDRAFRGVLLRALILTVLLLAGLTWMISWVLAWLLPDQLSLPLIGEITFLDTIGAGLGLGAGLILSVFLMLPVAVLFTGFFLDRIAAAVEAAHYPGLPAVPRQPFWHMLADNLRFIALVVLLNGLALVFYLAFIPFAPLIFWAVNGFLMGREYFQLVALRRLDLKSANALRKRHFWGIWLAGGLMAVPLSLPLVNLVIPILGVATFTHLFHRLNR